MRKIYIISIFIFLLTSFGKSQDIKIHYLGHSAFVLQFDNITVVTDYGKPNAWKEWGWDSPIYDIGDLVPDIMIYSHIHEDHCDTARIPNEVKFILKNGNDLEYKDLVVKAIPTCEDKFGDFNNYSYLFSYKGYNILHTGDIQTMIANIETDSIATYFKENYPQEIDLLIMPIEGKIKYVSLGDKFIQLLKPKTVIPCHYWSQEYLDEFIAHLKEKNLPDKKYDIMNNSLPNYFLGTTEINGIINIIILKRSSYIKL